MQRTRCALSHAVLHGAGRSHSAMNCLNEQHNLFSKAKAALHQQCRPICRTPAFNVRHSWNCGRPWLSPAVEKRRDLQKSLGVHSEAGKQEREEKLRREGKQASSDCIQHSNGISNTMWAMATMVTQSIHKQAGELEISARPLPWTRGEQTGIDKQDSR